MKSEELIKKVEDIEAVEFLKNGEYGILSTIGEDGYPYGVPVSYIYSDNNIFFHCATVGHKIDNINYSNKVSFCVVADVDVIPEKFTTRYRSVIAFGKVEEIDIDEKNNMLMMLCRKYSPEFIKEGSEYIQRAFENVKTFKIKIEHITGKKSNL